MNAMAIIQGIGSVGFFSSRIFLPAFITALLMRYGADIPGLRDVEMLKNIQGAPTWFTSDLCLIVLGVLATLEVAATKNEDARQLLEEVDQYAKPIMAGVTFLGLVNATDQQFIEQVVPQAVGGAKGAGFIDYLFVVLVMGGTYLGTTARNTVLSVLSEADEDDDAGVQKLISWAEDVWVVAGLVFLIVFPIVMLILIGIVTGTIVLLSRYAAYLEEKSKHPCTSCGELMYRSAIACGKCQTPAAEPCGVGFLGQSKSKPTTDLENHPYRLVEKKRCPVCATRFEQRAVQQTCAACGHELMADPAFAEGYVRYVGSRLPVVCGAGFLLSLLPVIGLIPGVIYYRMALVAPFRRYLPFGRRFFLKWGIRILFFFLIAVQVIPIAGGLVVPIMAVVSYAAYRSAYGSQLPDRGASQPLAA